MQLFVGILVVLFSSPSFALDSITNLPSGISSPGWRQGYIFGANQKYDAQGDLYSLSDLNAIELSVENLRAIEPDIKKLETALNKFGQNGLGSTLHLGVLKVTTEPTIKYSIPTFGHGINEQWMIGFGIPVIQYSNHLSFFHAGSNIGELRRQFYGVSDGLDEAFDRLDQDLIPVAQQTLSEKGYKPLVNRRQTFLGDIQLASFYVLYKNSIFGVRWQSFFNLPTGPQDDPDDLADLSAFGRTAWENSLLANFKFWRSFVFAVKVGFKWVVPDQIKARVPINDQDTLPGKDRLSIVDRDVGDSFTLGTSFSYALSNGFGLAAGLSNSFKGRDHYSGNLYGDYNLLERNTESYALTTHYELSYDTVALFLAKKALLPVIVSLGFTDNFRGRNIERLTQTEVSATLFF